MIQWSYSSLKQYKTCSRQYHEIRVLKNYPREETEQTLYGTELHAAVEGYIKGRMLDERFAFMEPVVSAILSKPGKKHAEVEMAVTSDLVPCAWDSEAAWCRGIADVLIVNSGTAWVVDWKTGNDKYPDKDQLTLMSLLTFAHYPEVHFVNSALIFVLKNNIVKHKVRRAEAAKHWARFREDVAKLEQSFDNGVWNPKESGLCKKWCPCTGCELNGRHFLKE